MSFAGILSLRGRSLLRPLPLLRRASDSSHRHELRFMLNGKPQVVKNFEADTFLIDYIRNSAGLPGTKLTCGEVDGMHVTTVEGLGSARDGKLHPTQERLAIYGGSQCGGCTPGFIMSMFTTLKDDPAPTRAKMLKSLDGNLCRCTGYRSIVDAASTFCRDVEPVPSLTKREYAPYDPDTDPEIRFPEVDGNTLHISGQRTEWIAPTTLDELVSLKNTYPQAKLVGGNTELGIEERYLGREYPIFFSVNQIPVLHKFELKDQKIEFGSAITLTHLWEKLDALRPSLQPHQQRALNAITEQLHWFSGTPIRNQASVSGNIMNASPISDLNPVWIALGAEFHLQSVDGARTVPAAEFFGPKYKQTAAKPNELLTAVSFNLTAPDEYIESYKQAQRREDDIAIVTASLYARVSPDGTIGESRLSYGGLAPYTLIDRKVSSHLQGKMLDWNLVDEATEKTRESVGLTGDVPGGRPEYRTALASGFLFKFLVSVLSSIDPGAVSASQKAATQKLYHALPSRFSHEFEELRTGTSVGDSVPHLASYKQVTGEALYVDDRPPTNNELKGFLVTSKVAHGQILSIDKEAALQVPGVRAVLTHEDVPGSKEWGDIFVDEEIFASKEVLHYKQPIGMVVADTEWAAKKAASLVRVAYKPLEEICTIDHAIAKESFYEQCKPRIDFGEVDEGLAGSDVVVEGEMRMGGQEHFYFEPQSTLVVPQDNDYIVYASTQNANKTQKWVAAALGVPMNRVTTHVSRLGGGFGGKETRNLGFSAAAAVAAHVTRSPVRLVLERDLDMTISGGRHPFKFHYKAGAKKDGSIQAADVQLWSNGGMSFDLSGPVLERAVLFCDGSYHWPALRSQGRICKTNMPSNTAFRGFGGPQGQAAAETMIDHLATELGIEDPAQLREQNLYNDGDRTYYGQLVTKNVRASWAKCKENSSYNERRAAIQQFNSENQYRKRGIVMLPSKYGIAFTFYALNQGGALVHVYTDGSVLVSHGGVEMGQGLHTKVAQTVATELGIPVEKVHIREMATDKVANAPPTAASLGSDTYAFAALDAAKQINSRLSELRERNPGVPFSALAQEAFNNRVNLSANGFFRSEHKGFNWEAGVGEPWRYFTLGTACVEVEIDCLTGDFKNLRTDLVVDVGKPINPAIDIGQIEGAFVQGAGLYTIEEYVWGDEEHPWVQPRGRNASNGPGMYKIPAADDIPAEWNIEIMKDSPVPKQETLAVHSSKAVGEPPLLLGMAVPFAIRDAIRSARLDNGLTGHFPLDWPLTAERIRMACAGPLAGPNAADFKAKGSF